MPFASVSSLTPSVVIGAATITIRSNFMEDYFIVDSEMPRSDLQPFNNVNSGITTIVNKALNHLFMIIQYTI